MFFLKGRTKLSAVLYLNWQAALSSSKGGDGNGWKSFNYLFGRASTSLIPMTWSHGAMRDRAGTKRLIEKGHYAPELADTILQNMHAHPREIQLKGIMVGNGVMDKVTDSRGMIDYWRSHALISSNTHQELMKFCSGQWSVTCPGLWSKVRDEVGALDLYSLSSETEACTDLHRSKCDDGFDPCDKSYVTKYLNLQHVQESLHVNKMIYPWQICSLVAEAWRDSPPTMLPIYKKLIAAGLRILLYSGDMDGVIPWTSTQYSINSLNLTMKKPWRVWMDVENKVGGHMEEYNGLTFAVVRGAGHEVPKYQPRKAFSLIKWFLKS